jgi:hypothetical protein
MLTEHLDPKVSKYLPVKTAQYPKKDFLFSATTLG